MTYLFFPLPPSLFIAFFRSAFLPFLFLYFLVYIKKVKSLMLQETEFIKGTEQDHGSAEM